MMPLGGLSEALGQGSSFTNNFKKFQKIAPGIDVFARSREDAAPFEKPIGEAQQRLAAFLGEDLEEGLFSGDERHGRASVGGVAAGR